MTDQDKKIFILMGVAGSGKTTVGKQVAHDLSCGFFEGDDYHSEAAKAQMASGQPLTDKDRIPWVQRMADAIDHSGQKCALLACSALSGFIRAEIRKRIVGDVHFIHLSASEGLLKKRLEGRRGHYMKPAMLASQLAVLEISPEMMAVDIDQPLCAVCSEVKKLIYSTLGDNNTGN